MQVELISPERVVFRGEASLVIARTLDGEIGFLTGHAPVLGVLLPGRLRIVGPDGAEYDTAVDSGFVEVCDDRVVVLVDRLEQKGEDHA
jgi:F-type H+-transporting ATPase subunit epsilon